MAAVEDAVRASQADIQNMLARSWHTWSSYAEKATTKDGFQPDCVQLRNSLAKVPAFLANDFEDHENLPFKLTCSGQVNNSALYLNGISKWRVSEGDCDLREKIMHHQLILGVQTSTRCDFVDDPRFANWPGIQGERVSKERGNYLAILSFAWAYISSVLWVEMQQSKDIGPKPVRKQDGVQYLRNQARWLCEADEGLPSDIEVDLGAVDVKAERWWTAILAPGEGWRATITRDDKVYQSPWSISLNASQSFKLRSTTDCQNVYNASHIPPSYREALTFLSDFCLLHNTSSQSSAALAANLTFPFLNTMNATLPMPKPDKVTRPVLSTTPLQPSSSASKLETDIVFEDGRYLPYYMTLSCNRRGMRSLLCGAFYDPEVSCNLVSPWLEPMFSVIDPVFQRCDYEKLSMIIGHR